MRELTMPSSRLIEYEGGIFKILAKHKNNNYNREELGHLVKYYGGNKILQSHDHLLICSEVEEAEIVS